MTSANKSEGAGIAQLPGQPATFSKDMNPADMATFLGDNGIPLDVYDVFEGMSNIPVA